MIFVTVGTHEQQFNRLIKKIDMLAAKKIIKESSKEKVENVEYNLSCSCIEIYNEQLHIIILQCRKANHSIKFKVKFNYKAYTLMDTT